MRICKLAEIFVFVMVAGFAQAVDQPTVTFLHRSAVEELAYSYKGSQRLEGTILGQLGWIEAQTELSPSGVFFYKIVREGGSSRVRQRGLKPFLEAERNQSPKLSAFTTENYEINSFGTDGDLLLLKIHPKRKATNLIEGFLFVRSDGDLVRVEGQLSKSPSPWMWGEKFFRYYGRVSGVRMPVKMVSTAIILFNPSTLVVEYRYDEVNGRQVQQIKHQ